MRMKFISFSACIAFAVIPSLMHKAHSSLQDEDLQAKWGSDWPFSGINTFAHLNHVQCLLKPDSKFDIAIVGVPIDTAVSYRPGARFGPRAIRAASARQIPYRAFNSRAGINPYNNWATVIDCGDVPVSPFDKVLAEKQMTEAYLILGNRSTTAHKNATPRLITLGGDHSLALPALRALRKIYGEPIAVVHFDAHLDTWDPSSYPSAWIAAPDPDDLNAELPPSWFNHGSMFWLAHKEGLIASSSKERNGSACCNVHAGLRCRLSSAFDHVDDTAQGWTRISADAIDDIGAIGVARLITSSIGDPNRPVYLSVDIDVLDPGLAPGTGTPEPGGWTSRELIRILRALEGLNVVGADVVEVSPAYDGTGEETALAAAQVVFEMLTNLVKRGMTFDGNVLNQKSVKDEL